MSRLRLFLALALTATLLVPAGPALGAENPRRTLSRYAADTWRSFVLMTDETTGLPADNVSADGTRAAYTSPTNIGAYLWSTIAARSLGIIRPREARERMAQTLDTLEGMERGEAGQFYNWYDPATGAKLEVWPVDGNQLYPFLSSVDNGWLATALTMVRNTEPRLAAQADALLEPMDFGFYYDPAVGQLRGGYWPAPPPGQEGCGGFTCFHYGTLNTEPRIASYLGIAAGDIPPEHYFRTWRTFPDTCDWSWQEQRPEGEYRTYLGVEVFEGTYGYRGARFVPTWGGSMFEALMVPLFVPETRWGPRSWGENHPVYVQAQIAHGLDEAAYGYWGFSPSNNPSGGYREYGVDQLGMNPDGYSSDQERTVVDEGFAGCREPQPPPAGYGQGVVTPHASFLALPFARSEALANLANLERDFDAYGEGGFYDAVNVTTGEVSRYWLALDQGMVMAALANELRGDVMQRTFVRGEVQEAIRPLLGIEEFGTEPAP
jgi:hypothetical protein